jgi:hypothetical protein
MGAYLSGREAALDEVRYRASGGAQGTAPGARIASERRAATASVARFMRKANGAPSAAPNIPEGGGSALPSRTKSQMERRLGADLSGVKIHTGGESAQAASELGARAFTVGSDVHFNAGQFYPGSKEGDRLIAHELTHVVQGQRSGIQRKAEEGDEAKGADAQGGGPAVSQPEEPAEKEADAVADHVAGDLHGDNAGEGDNAGKGDKAGDTAGEGEQGAKASHGGDAGSDAKHDGHGNAGGSARTDEKGGDKAGAKADEQPAPISAKLEGVGLKVWRAGAPGTTTEDGKIPTVEQWTQFMTETATDHPDYTQFGPKIAKWGLDPESLWKDVMKGLALGVPATSLPRVRDPGDADPTAKADYESKLGAVRNAQKPSQAHFDGIAKQLADVGGFSIAKDQSCVYSGPFAREKANSGGGKVLEDTAAGAFDKLKLMVGATGKNEWSAIEPLWRALSAEYAKAATGTVRGYFHYMGETFAQVERPILEAKAATGSGVKLEYYALFGKPGVKKFDKPEDVDQAGPFADQGGWQGAKAAAKAQGRLVL